jgi:hypothetical protein
MMDMLQIFSACIFIVRLSKIYFLGLRVLFFAFGEFLLTDYEKILFLEMLVRIVHPNRAPS